MQQPSHPDDVRVQHQQGAAGQGRSGAQQPPGEDYRQGHQRGRQDGDRAPSRRERLQVARGALQQVVAGEPLRQERREPLRPDPDDPDPHHRHARVARAVGAREVAAREGRPEADAPLHPVPLVRGGVQVQVGEAQPEREEEDHRRDHGRTDDPAVLRPHLTRRPDYREGHPIAPRCCRRRSSVLPDSICRAAASAA